MDDNQNDYDQYTSDDNSNDDEANERSVPDHSDGHEEDDAQDNDHLVPSNVDGGDEDGPLNNQKFEAFPRVVYTEEFEEDDVICTVCQSEMRTGETIVMLPDCFDKYHAECIQNWFKRSSKCPNCREAY